LAGKVLCFSSPSLLTTIVTDAAVAEAEGRRDSGISVASSLMTTTCVSELPVVSQHAAIIEEAHGDLLSTSVVVASQPVSDNSAPAVLPWISISTDQGCGFYCR